MCARDRRPREPGNLNIFEDAFRSDHGPTDRRWRVEHAQHLSPQDIPRFAKLGVIASMQGIHCTSDAIFVLAAARARAAPGSRGPMCGGRCLIAGAVVTNGTDTPVEDVNPIDCFYATVTRKLANGTTFFPKQKMTRGSSSRTRLSNAYAAFEENLRGR